MYDHIEYWINSAENDLAALDILYNSQKYDWSLFIGHLVLKKMFKALYVKINENSNPPKTHNLLKLAKDCKLDLSYDKLTFLDLVNSFHFEARYPDYKQEFYKIVDKEFAEENILKIKEYYQWLKSLLK